MNPAPARPKTTENASDTSAVLVELLIMTPVSRSTRPVERITNAVIEQMMIVSANTSKIPHMPCATGSLTLDAECTMTLEPRPASLEKTPRFIPQVSAVMTP